MTARASRTQATGRAEIRQNKRFAHSRPEGGFELRVYHRKGDAKKAPRYLVKCGCCENKVEVYYFDNWLEINGVIAPLENWREVLLPLLFPDGISPDASAARSNRVE